MRRLRLLVLVSLVCGTTLAAAERQRPLRPWQFTKAVCHLLEIPEQQPLTALPALPPRSGALDGSIRQAYRSYLDACLDIALDPRDERPAMHYWRIDWLAGREHTRVAGAAQTAQVALAGVEAVDEAEWSRLRPGQAAATIRLYGVPAGIYRLSLGCGVASPDLRGPRPVRLLVEGSDGRRLFDEFVSVRREEAPLLSVEDLFIGDDGKGAWRLTVLAADGIPDPAAARLLLDRVRIEGPCFNDDRWPPELQRKPVGEEVADAEFLARTVDELVQRAWFLTTAEVDGTAEPIRSKAEAARRRQGLAGGLRQALTAILDDPRFLYLERAPGSGVPEQLSQNEFAARVGFAVYGRCPETRLRHDRVWRHLNEDFAAEAAKDQKKSEGHIRRHARIKMWREGRDTPAAAVTIGRLLADDLLDLDALVVAELSVPDELRASFIAEARATIAANYRRHRPAVELLDWRQVVVDRLLAQHYDVPAGPPGSLRPMPVHDQHPRGGVLGFGAVLVAHPDAAARMAFVDDHLFGGDAPNLPDLRIGLAGFGPTGVWRGDAAAAEAFVAGRQALRAAGGRFVLELRRRLARLITGAELSPPDAKAVSKVNEAIAKDKCPSLNGLVEGFLWGDDPLIERRH